MTTSALEAWPFARRASILLNVLFREAVRALLRHKLRSSLATLGITIGTAALILVIAIGRAGSERIAAELHKLGDNLVWLEAGARNVAGVRTGNHGTNTLTLDDAEAVTREVKLIARGSPQVDGNLQAMWGNRNWATRFRGGSPDYLAIRRYEVASGTNFTRDDVERFATKVLIGQTVRQQLFGAADPVGETLRLQGQLFEVVGVLAPKGQSPDGRDQDDWVFLPYTTAQTRFRARNITWLDDAFFSAVSAEAVPHATEQIVALMRQRHHIEPGQEDDFNIRRPDELLKVQQAASDTLAMLLAAVASISLVVGGIGIMNVMLASVTQRTREIGLRLAVGATDATVRAQFLGEAGALSLVGGVLGVAVSLVAALGSPQLLGMEISIPPSAPVLAVASSVAVGMFFGFYPAWRASRLDPIEALRHE